MEQIFDFSFLEVTLVGNPIPKFERRITVSYPTEKLIQIVTLTNRVFTGFNFVSIDKNLLDCDEQNSNYSDLIGHDTRVCATNKA